MEIRDYDVVVVGAGIFGLVSALELGKKGLRVAVIEKRNHIGGNVFSYKDIETNIEVHKYGSHIFHTSQADIWTFVNRFSSWIPYEHHVYSISKNRVYPLPFNLFTLSLIRDQVVSPGELEKYLQFRERSRRSLQELSLEEHAINEVGIEVYETLIKGYTEKQWGISAKELPARIISRLPIRSNFNGNYFNDTYQALPSYGYGHFLENIADESRADFYLETEWNTLKNNIRNDTPIIYSGCIDEFFDYSEGVLSWRTLDIKTQTLPIKDFQGTPVMNFADSDITHTRIHEYRHYPVDREISQEQTVISHEYSRLANSSDEKYYPIETPNNLLIVEKYKRLASENAQNVIFGGRLGSYKYMDMHTAIASAISKIRNNF